MRYFVRRDRYRVTRSLHRFDAEAGVSNRFDLQKGEWIDDPELIAFTGIGGDHDLFEVAPADLRQVVEGAWGTETADLALKGVAVTRGLRRIITRGGPGSGHFGHAGRPGEVGGSAPGEGTAGAGSPSSKDVARAAKEAGPESYRASLEAALEGSPYTHHVNHYSAEELGGMKALLLADGGMAGVAVKDHGDGRIEATALFHQAGGTPGVGLALLRRSIADYGVNYGEAFMPILPKMYERVGFEVMERYPFDPEQAPAGWDRQRFDEPDYVTMRLKGT